MQEMMETIKNTARRLLADKTAVRIVGWTQGDFLYDPTPAVFDSPESLENLVYGDFCGANLSKYLIRVEKSLRWFESASLRNLVDETAKPGKTAVLLKPCDAYSFNQLVHEHRAERDGVYVVGVPCPGMLDIEKIRALGIKSLRGVKRDSDKLTIQTKDGDISCRLTDVLLSKCLGCKSKTHVVADEVIEPNWTDALTESDRFSQVGQLEAMNAEERYTFCRIELSN